jgi:uncharacterized protein (TIGR01244 family)
VRITLIALALAVLTACAVANNSSDASALSAYLKSTYAVEDRVLIGGQPSAQALERLSSGRISTVINFRSRAEIDSLKFDQPALLKDAGVAYHQIGVGGGDGSYTPEKLEQFNELMEAAGKDQILLHCRSGHRASQIYAAWLVKYRGLSPDEALNRVAPSGWWPMPMERMLGQPLSVSVEEG